MNWPRLPALPSAEDSWRLLTPLNISTRRLWPWSFSIQKFVDSGEPRPRASPNLLIASDYGGDHRRATHNVYCFLVVRGEVRAWFSAMNAVRRSLLPNRRRMSYKRLGDPHRQDAVISFLNAAAALDAHLVAIAVDKRKKWLSTVPGSADILRDQIGFKAKWNERSLEAMLRKAQFTAIMLSIWAQPYTNVTWITDQDEFVANDTRHDDALLATARMTSFYLSHPMGIFRLNTTDQDPDKPVYEDLCSIPDLAAGMLSEVATRLSKDTSWEDGVRRELRSPLPWKADLIADWFWDDEMTLRKTLISVDVHGTQFGIRKVWMQSDGATDKANGPLILPDIAAEGSSTFLS